MLFCFCLQLKIFQDRKIIQFFKFRFSNAFQHNNNAHPSLKFTSKVGLSERRLCCLHNFTSKMILTDLVLVALRKEESFPLLMFFMRRADFEVSRGNEGESFRWSETLASVRKFFTRMI